ncbi:hypothetical protein ES703_99645 [subsurface metagenome]
MGGKLTKENKQRMAQGLVALLCARALILEGREALKDMPPETPDVLQPYMVMAFIIPACVLITQTFGTGELRDEAFKVLAKITNDESEVLGGKG